MKDQKKRRGFMCMFIYCSCPLSHFWAWHSFHDYVKWVGYLLPLSPDYSIEFILRRLVTLPVIHGVWCLFRQVNVAESYYLISQLAWKSSALNLTHYLVLRTSPPVSDNFDHYIIYPCFMSIDGGYIKASLRRISSCRLQHIIRERNLETCHSCGTLETIFLIGGFPRAC